MSDIREVARGMRKLIERMACMVPDDEAEDFADFHPLWSGDGVTYKTGLRVRYNGVLYKVLQGHVSQPDWTPEAAVSLFARVLVSENPDIILEWEQPDSTNPYAKGDRVIHGGEIWRSTIDSNVWEPGVYGWEKE